MNSRHVWWFLLTLLVIPEAASAQMTASLQTADTYLQFEASPSAPRVASLRMPNHSAEIWTNRSSEIPIRTVEIQKQSKPIVWRFNPSDSRVNTKSVSFVYDSSSPRLRLTWEWTVRSAGGPIEHEIRIENRGTREVWLPLQSSFSFEFDSNASEELEQFYVEKGADSPSTIGTHLVPIRDGYAWEETSSTYAQPRPGEAREILPYFLVERSGGARGGWYVGIEFSGRTHLTLARQGDSLSGEVGLNPYPGPFRTRLKPDATFETPRIFLGATSGGPDVTGNVLRRWVRDVLTNVSSWKDPHYPLVVNNSWGGGMAVNDGIARRMIADSADLGMEMFHLDAGWFRDVGDWHPDPKKFPHGLGVIADAAHARGLRFGLWADWAQAGISKRSGALNVSDPEVHKWTTTGLPANWKPEEFKGQTIDIGVPEAKAWALKETNRIVQDYKLDMLEHDGYLVAKGCDAGAHPHAAPDPLNKCTYRDSGFIFSQSSNSTDVSYHAVRAYYEVQSTLRKNHPGLLLEICNDGGRMMDFGSAAHGDYFSITDTYDPLSNRRAFYDASFVFPPAMLEAYVESWPPASIENFRYMLRSGMMGWLSIMIDTTSWNASQHAAAKEEIELYKSTLRPLIRDANLYHVSLRPDGVHWDGIEYIEPKTGRGAVYAFHGSDATESTHTFLLQGLSQHAHYQLRFQDHTSPDRVLTGEELMQAGLEVRLPAPHSSEIVLLKEVEGH